jgi:WD40 repeat protein/tRNA A-37 threonylcarbamoyl transferase component Bud32
MPIDTLSQFLQALRDSTLLTPEQWYELETFQPQFPEMRDLARELVKRGWLTPYQVNQLARGRGKELVLGPYHLLEALGEGGMGQVFKARHPLMKRVVALKVIRAERLRNADALPRFLREIEAAAKLSHPNVVIAHDAAQVGNSAYFAMEYVAGTDLGKLVRQRGPLSVGEACNYVRQAALGLQHAHQHGLVHRDVKPANLLLTAEGGVVKVLDLGLARVRASAPEESITALTEDGTLMGTPDYMAPEQASNAHTVDIRADVYSLGCTLYALLAGRAPFAGGSLAQKVAAHLHVEPPPLEGLRADLPPGLTAVVRRMMAKNPAQRYQTPAEVAAALSPFCQPVPSVVPVAPVVAGLSPASSAGTSTVAFDDRTAAEPMTVPPAARRLPRWLLPAGAGGILLLVLVWVLAGGSQRGAPDGQNGPGPGQTVTKPQLEFDPDAPTVEVRRFEGHTDQVNSVVVSPDGQFALSGSVDGTVRLWDVKTGAELHQFQIGKSVWCVALSPDGKYAAAGEGVRLEAGEWKDAPPYHIHVWDVAARKQLHKYKAHDTEILAVALLPGGQQLLSCCLDGIWLREVDGTGTPRRLSGGRGDFSIPLSADGELALLVEPDSSLRLWNARTWESLRALTGHTKGIRSLALSADGRRALSSGWDKTVRLWDAKTGKEIRQLPEHPTIVTGLAISPDGRWGATGSGTAAALKGAKSAGFDYLIRLFDLESGKEVRSYQNTAPILTLTFSADGRYLFSGGDSVIRLWRWAK